MFNMAKTSEAWDTRHRIHSLLSYLLFIGWLAVPGTVDLDKYYYTTLVDQKVWYVRVKIQDRISQNKNKCLVDELE